LTLALCSLPTLGEKECEEAAGALVGYFDEQEESHRLIRAIVAHEVLTRGPSTELFAEPDDVETPPQMSAVIMAFYLEELASDYLTNTMQAGLDLALNLDGDLGLEGAHSTDEVQRILANLTHVCSEVVNSVCQSTGDVPVILSYVAFLIHQAMAPYPEHTKKVLSSFLFRRFFCPKS